MNEYNNVLHVDDIYGSFTKQISYLDGLLEEGFDFYESLFNDYHELKNIDKKGLIKDSIEGHYYLVKNHLVDLENTVIGEGLKR